MKHVLPFLKPYLALIVLALCLLIVQANCDLALPDYLSRIVDGVISSGGEAGSELVSVGLMMLLLTLIGGGSAILVNLLAAKTAAGAARDLRNAVFKKVSSFSSQEFDTFSASSLITRTTNDVNHIQMMVMALIRMVFFAPIMGIGGIIRAIGKSSSMWWILALAVTIIVSVTISVFMLVHPKIKLMQKLMDRLNLVSRELLTGMMVIRAFGRQDLESERYDSANQKLAANMLFVNRTLVTQMPLMMLIMNIFSILIVWIGAGRVNVGKLQVGDMMAFMQYAIHIFFSFLMMSIIFIMLPRAAVSADRIGEVLAAKEYIRDPENPKTLALNAPPSVEFRSVSFRYPGAEEDVLRDISFTAESGKTTAIIGATGSGKSTMAALAVRFYDVSGGAVLVGGVDVRELRQSELRSIIGLVQQKTVLFSGNVESNLRYAAPDADLAALAASIHTAQADELIEAGHGGFSAPISQGGGNLSGGQKQRMAIARALIKKPPIFIFDDSFSALDFKTDAALRQALKSETSASALIIISQRVATIMGADQIIVLDEGRIAGIGTHRSLMTECQAYREIAESQLDQEELR